MAQKLETKPEFSLELHRKMHKKYLEEIEVLTGLTGREIERLGPAVRPVRKFIERKERSMAP